MKQNPKNEAKSKKMKQKTYWIKSKNIEKWFKYYRICAGIRNI